MRNKKPCPYCGERTLKANLYNEMISINKLKVLIEFDYFTRKCTNCAKFILTPNEYSDIIRTIRRQKYENNS